MERARRGTRHATFLYFDSLLYFPRALLQAELVTEED